MAQPTRGLLCFVPHICETVGTCCNSLSLKIVSVEQKNAFLWCVTEAYVGVLTPLSLSGFRRIAIAGENWLKISEDK